jgi:photosystem II stability/assembly factor-like uncharacterized protein
MATVNLRSMSRSLHLLFVAVLLVLGYSSPGQAGLKWKIKGPEGGQVNCFVSPDATGTLIYTGCSGGVYKSTDAGEHWQFLPKSPAPVYCLAINPLNPYILYAGGANGVSRSSDGGRTWQLTLNSVHGFGTGARIPTGLAVDPILPQNVYATFSNTLTIGITVHGPFCHSTDGGQTWTETKPAAVVGENPAFYLNTIYSLAVDPSQPSIIYVSAPGGGYSGKWRSQDGGQNFRLIFSESSQIYGGRQIYAEPGAPGVLYSYGSGYGYGVTRSNDWGDIWFNAHAPNAIGLAVISQQGMGGAVLGAFDTRDPNFPLGGVAKGYYAPFSYPWMTFNNGLGNGLVPLSTVLALQPHVPYGAFAGMASGVYRTKTMDNDGNWLPKNKGLTNAVVTCLAVAPDPQHTIYAGTLGGGIFKSTDCGKSWQAINQGLGLSEEQKADGVILTVNAVAVERPNYNKLYAATNIGLFRSLDGGATWLPPVFTWGAESVITDPLVPGTVYAIGGDDWASSYSTWYSTDAGQTWGHLGQGAPGSAGVTLVNGPFSFPIYGIGGSVMRLQGLNDNWEELFTGLCLSMAVDPRTPDTLYIGTKQNGVYKTVDGGESWLQISSPPFNFTPQREVTAIAVDPTNCDVYVGLQNGGWQYEGADQTGTLRSGGVWKSSDGGVTWTDLGLPSYRGVNAVALDPAKQAIYCGLDNAGVAVAMPYGEGIPAVMELLLLN